MRYQIYLITNKINGKQYVGQTQAEPGYLIRYRNHINDANTFYHSNCVLHNAIHKYGAENFKVELIEDNIEESEIDEKEKFYIAKFDTFFKDGKGYNMTYGGQGIHGYQHTDETKNKLSKISKSYWTNLKENDPTEYQRLCKLRSDNLKGKPKSELAKKHYSEAAQKHTHSEGYVNPFKGKHHTEETKRIVGEKNSVKVGMYDPKTLELIKEFKSAVEATNYLIENNLTNNASAKSRIFFVCDKPNKIAYGFIWRRLS